MARRGGAAGVERRRAEASPGRRRGAPGPKSRGAGVGLESTGPGASRRPQLRRRRRTRAVRLTPEVAEALRPRPVRGGRGNKDPSRGAESPRGSAGCSGQGADARSRGRPPSTGERASPGPPGARWPAGQRGGPLAGRAGPRTLAGQLRRLRSPLPLPLRPPSGASPRRRQSTRGAARVPGHPPPPYAARPRARTDAARGDWVIPWSLARGAARRPLPLPRRPPRPPGARVGVVGPALVRVPPGWPVVIRPGAGASPGPRRTG